MNFNDVITFSNKNRKVFELLCKDLKRGGVVPYIGAGMSAFIYPTWSSALKMMADDVDDDKTKEAIKSKAKVKPIDAAEDLVKTVGDGNLIDSLVEIFGKKEYNEDLLRHGAISMLPRLFGNSSVITTNFDRLLETVFDMSDVPFDAAITPLRTEVAKTAKQRGLHVLFKIHGDISPNFAEDIVLTREQYRTAYAPNSPGKKYVDSMLNNRVVLFLGCSLCQDIIVETLQELNSDRGLKHYALISCKKEDRDNRRKELDDLGIRSILYPEKEHEAVEIILRELVSISGNTGTVSTDLHDDGFIYDEKFHIDTYAYKAHSFKIDNALAKGILTQNVFQNRTKRIAPLTLSSICQKIAQCTSQYPLIISGQPGTGKSTLLSLIYINFIPPIGSKKFLIDLHRFEVLEAAAALKLLRATIDFISIECQKSNSVYLFVDGLDGYERLSNDLVCELQNYLETQKNSNNFFAVLAVGELDESLFPPFTKSKLTPIVPDEKITLAPISVESGQFEIMAEKVIILSIDHKFPKRRPTGKSEESKEKAQKYDELIGKARSFCKRLRGNSVEFRTVTIFAEGYLLYGESIFSKKIGGFLLDYVSKQINNKKIPLSEYAKDVTNFLLRTGSKQQWSNAIFFKSPVFRDFLFAYHYLEVIKSTDIEGLGVFNCIFTASINRILIDLITLDQAEELTVIKTIISMFDKMGSKAKAQTVYIIGRVASSKAKNIAKDFLKSQYELMLNEFDAVKRDQDKAMLFRSVGISLIYLGVNDYESSFYHKLIYDEVIKQININFHIAYYSNNAYKIGDDVHLDSRELCTSANLNRLYNFLWNSVKDSKISDNRGKRNVNIITLVSLYIRMIYPEFYISKGEGEVATYGKKDSFVNLIKNLSADVSITNSEIKGYLKNISIFIESDDVYSYAFKKLYNMKTIQRSGWSQEGREVNKKARVESDADHTWACCMLASVFLTDKIDDCIFLSDEEKIRYADSYSLDKIIRLLLVHDLPEVYTGDIPAKKQDKAKKKKQETAAMQSLAVLDSFPGFNSFTWISDCWYEYEKQESINARIAYQIDQIEPLIQLYIYRGFIPERERMQQKIEWLDYAQNSIQSSASNLSFGYNLIEFLSKYILRDEYFC